MQDGDSTGTRFPPGSCLGPYVVETQLGSGGMGEVFRARDTRLHRTVAIKTLPHDRLTDPDRKRRFLQEARAASALNHPNIVIIYDISNEGATDFLVMEYVRGKTIKDLVAAEGLRFAQVCEYGAQIASALAAAHAAGIVHRDIKPANIMVTPEGQVKVLDFGVAKLNEPVDPEGKTRTQSDFTAPGTVVGTYAYMSPEQTRGETLDGRSDIFSLGCVLYECATGQLPFQGPSVLAIMHEIATGSPAAPSGVRNDVAPEFDRVVERALAKNPEDRYASAAEMAGELRALVGAPASQTAAAMVVKPKRRQLAVAASIAAILIAAALAYWLLSPQMKIDSIAVLPFTNTSNDPNVDYQTDGLTEELINSLTQAPNLRVIARATVFRYKGKPADPGDVGKQLGVRAVLMGRVVRLNDRASVQVDLVDVKDGSQIWGRQYNRSLPEIPALHEEIAQQIVERLRPGGDNQRLAKRHIVNPEAYDLYLKGRQALSEMTGDRVRQSMVYFQQATMRDPNFAAAYAGLADSYSYLGVFELESPRDVMPKAKEAALKALELDNETAAAHTSLAIVQSIYDWDWAGSEKRFRRAVELNPGDAYAQHWLGHYFETMGRWQDAQDQMQKALALDPLNPMYLEDLGYDLFINHRYDEAIQQLKKVVELAPEDPIAHAFLALALEAKGRRSESLAANERARQYIINGSFVTGSVAGVFVRNGRPEEARKMLVEIQTSANKQYSAPLQTAMIHFALGEPDEGFRLLNLSAEQRDLNLQYEVTDPTFNSVRRDQRLVALRQKLGLPAAAWLQ